MVDTRRILLVALDVPDGSSVHAAGAWLRNQIDNGAHEGGDDDAETEAIGEILWRLANVLEGEPE